LRLVGELGELEIPPGLTALIASRLDALSPDERRLVKECSVLGGSFPRQAIEAVSDTDPADLDELLSSLVRKEVLTVRADKLSPERGQYAFTQSLIRSVAYDMLTRAERKARHLRTAEHLRSAFPDEGAEVAEVIGAHLYDAYKAAGDDPDAEELRDAACDAYTRAAERAELVGAPEASESAYLKAAELSSDEAQQAAFTEHAGRMASFAGWNERAVGHFEAAIAAHDRAGRVVEVAGVTAELGSALNALGHGEQALVRLQDALGTIDERAAPPAVLAALQLSLSSALHFTGHTDESAEPLERALILAQFHELPEVLARALNSRGVHLMLTGRIEEARLHYEGAVVAARRAGVTRVEQMAEGNLADLLMTHDLPGAEAHCQAALALSRRSGARQNEAFAAGNLMYVLMSSGHFDEARQLATDLLHNGGDDRPGADELRMRLAQVMVLQGDLAGARENLESCRALLESDDFQMRTGWEVVDASVTMANGDYRHALKAARSPIDQAVRGTLFFAHESVRAGFPEAIDAAIALSDLAVAKELIEILATRSPGELPPFLRAQVARAKALVFIAAGGTSEVEELLDLAEATFRDLSYPYWTARSQLDRAEWLAGQGHQDAAAALASEASATFERLGTRPMLVRAQAISRAAAEVG
jgi:tetratricopeptide (TPR) repeat protein